MTDDKSPFSAPDKIDAQAEGYVDEKLKKAKDENKATTDKATSNTRTLQDEQVNTDDKELNKNQDANYATMGGQYGNVNKRDYSTTLRLAREADKYNNKPVGHMFSVGTRKTGGLKDRGIGYDRPKIATMETRAMDQAFQLDTSQKQLAQALQNAVNNKNLDAFRMAHAQIYGIYLSEMQAEYAMTQVARQQEQAAILTKSLSTFNQLFNRSFDAQTVTALYNTAKTNSLFGAALAAKLTGGPMPSLNDYTAQDFRENFMVAKLGDNWRKSASATEQAKYLAEADTALNMVYYDQNITAAAQISGVPTTIKEIKAGLKAGFGAVKGLFNGDNE